MAKQGRIVAELGRPETPEETAARKAAASIKHRTNQTISNLLLALGASLAIVLLIVLVVVRPDQPPAEPTDYVTVAAQAQPGVDQQLATPVLPPEWSANRAELEPALDESFTWYIGFLTPEDRFIALEQGIDPTPGWIAQKLGRGGPTSTQQIGGVEWDVYDRRDNDDAGNYAFSLAATIGETPVLLHGTASEDEFAVLAASVISELQGAGDQ
ncbi:DUF4245 domain-containing protein [Marisediminicola senii]|uniref:DUF4245 domain-containing protein n=1 Tax=Marisediminicola senii TaxID=2711233 RepID=UPI0013EA20F7|nr:DUF4245 domain-containing protein [Marisediminicola senii]